MGNTQTGASHKHKEDIKPKSKDHKKKDNKKKNSKKKDNKNQNQVEPQEEEAQNVKTKIPPVLHFNTDITESIVSGQDNYTHDESSTCDSDLSKSYSFSDNLECRLVLCD